MEIIVTKNVYTSIASLYNKLMFINYLNFIPGNNFIKHLKVRVSHSGFLKSNKHSIQV
ncbi:MAG: hypothetical protein AMXMBFR51_09810 [Ignavibacteriota bacterium]